MKTARLVLCACIALGISIPAVGQSLTVPEDAEEVGTATDWTSGLIFSTDSVLLDIYPFNSGVGLARRGGEKAYRGAVGVYGSNSFSTVAAKLGVWWVNYLWVDRVAPYWTVFGRFDLLSQTNEFDEANWTRSATLAFGVGASLGVEFFLLDFLSLFGEYSLSAGASGSRASASTGGEVTRGDLVWTYSAGTDIANKGAIGLIIYFRPQMHSAEDQTDL